MFEWKISTVDIEFVRVAANVPVVFVHGHGAEDFGLHLAAHVHAGAVDNQDFGHGDDLPRDWCSMQAVR